MQIVSLVPHPAHPPCNVRSIKIELHAEDPDQMLITYWLDGDDTLIPASRSPDRREGLWQTTCFEAFIRPHGGDAYFEFNFSPSGEWAAYRFDAYRTGAVDLQMPVEPFIDQEGDEPAWDVDLDLSALPPPPYDLALTAVIEELNGTKSYWALAHPDPEKPDFHHFAGFVLALPAAGAHIALPK